MMIQSETIRNSRVVAVSIVASLFLGGCLGGGGGGDTTGAVSQSGAVTATGTSVQPADTASGSGDTTDGATSSNTQPAETTTTAAADTTAVLAWQPPAANIDGSALVDLQGFNVYMGESVDAMKLVATTGATLNSYTVNNLSAGTYYFAVSAYSQAGAESALSNAVSKTITN